MSSVEEPSPRSGFEELNLSPLILKNLITLGYEEPTPIQKEAIPHLISGRDLLGQAATGTGKTAAFALPLLQRLLAIKPGHTSALILVPTRELAMQVAEAIHRYSRDLERHVLPIYGGQWFGQQVRALERGVDVVVGTPGRVLDHLNRGTLQLNHVQLLVLDEADEMLDMGFADDLEAILSATPSTRQTALFSATMPPRISAIASKHLREPVRVTIAREALNKGELPKVRQSAYMTLRSHKIATLSRVLDVESPESAIVFCRTRTEVDELTQSLIGYGHRAEALHGGLSQEQRDRVMARFRANTVDLLVATDVAARGLDIDHVSHVVNYDLPSSPESYVHRIGRTGRAGRSGVAITLVEPREMRLLRNIEYQTQRKIEVSKVPTLADLKARRLELLRMSLVETLQAGEFEHLRTIVDSLSAEFDPVDVAAAALKMVQQSAAGEQKEEEEIPILTPWELQPREGRFQRRPGDRYGRGDDDYDRRGPRRPREGGFHPLDDDAPPRRDRRFSGDEQDASARRRRPEASEGPAPRPREGFEGEAPAVRRKRETVEGEAPVRRPREGFEGEAPAVRRKRETVEGEAPVRRPREGFEGEAPAVRRKRETVEGEAPVRRPREGVEGEAPAVRRKRETVEGEAPVRRPREGVEGEAPAVRRKRETVEGEAPVRRVREPREGAEQEAPARRKREGTGWEEPAPVDEGGQAPLRRAKRVMSRQEASQVRLYVNVGRESGVEPKDLIRAVVIGSGLEARAIGAIEIAERHSLVEVPSDSADELIESLKGTRICGRPVNVRRFRDG